MGPSTGWRKTISGLLGIFADEQDKAVETLSRLYCAESQHSRQIAHHAERMQYPQFRDKLRAIAADEDKHARWMAEKIRALGGTVPAVPGTATSDKNSWEYLVDDLEDQRRCAAELLVDITRLQGDFPEVADMLQRVYDEGSRHREELRSMLMRSDPQAHLAA